MLSVYKTLKSEPLTLSKVAKDPNLITTTLTALQGKEVIFRPLLPSDIQQLAIFLTGLSPETRDFCTYEGYDEVAAQSFCDAIDRYDKLRMVAIVDTHIVALFEFSLYISATDKEHYHGYGIELDEAKDIRFGPCVADEYQSKGLGSNLLAHMVNVARQFGKERLILWGGVLTSNHRAIRYYQRNGFRMVGSFQNASGFSCQSGILTV